MPRAARERLTLQADKEQPSSACCSSSSNNVSSDSRSCPETTENASRQEASPSLTDGILDPSSDSSMPCPLEEKQKLELRLQEDEALVLEQTQCCFADMTMEEEEKEQEYVADVPHSPQTEDTDADDVTEEIKAHLKQAVTFSIEHVHNDYSIYENVCVNSDDFGHVIEIYDFPAMFKTDDLLDAFTEYSDGGMKIKWVDNTHALGVFSSEAAALHALSICHPLLKVRALAEGSKKARGKAMRRAEFIQPVKERPRTDSAVARRMVARALGIPGRGRVKRY